MVGGPDSSAAAGSDQTALQDFTKPVAGVASALLAILDNQDDLSDQLDMYEPPHHPNAPSRDALLVLLPLLIILSSLLFLLLLFLICVLLIRRRRGIILRDSDGPTDLSREDLNDVEGGFDGLEERWLESVSEETRRSYRRAKEYQSSYPPNSLPTDITLSQFLSIQEKGVSAWSFEPDYESNASLLVHARTELTFLPDPSSSSCVQSNLPLPKLNEVYYWEVKMFDLPETTSVGIGLATKPYPIFRLPGQNKFSVAYLSNGDKSHNFPFLAQSYGPSLKEGDVLGVGYRPRTGTVFFTKNGRKMDDAYVGLTRWNLFPTVGADGPCSLHVNLGQSGFVFIEANVKKWGLAPSVGTLAPPPAYGSERGSILLEAGGGIRTEGSPTPSPPPPPVQRRSSHRSRRSKNQSSLPSHSSPLRNSTTTPDVPLTPPPPITPIDEEQPEDAGPSDRYVSPTDASFHAPAASNLPPSPPSEEDDSASDMSPSRSRSPSARIQRTHSRNNSAAAEMVVRFHPPPESPMNPDLPSPDHHADIHLRPLTPASQIGSGAGERLTAARSTGTSRPPPAYSPLDAYRYSDGVHVDLPAEVIAAALEGGSIPASAVGTGHNSSHSSRRSRRERRQ